MSEWRELKCEVCEQPGHESAHCPVESWLKRHFLNAKLIVPLCINYASVMRKDPGAWEQYDAIHHEDVLRAAMRFINAGVRKEAE